MLSDEEKKTLEKFKNFIYTYQEVIEDEYSDYEEKESAKEYQEVSEKIINLIEKQSKEIEELNNRNNKLMEELDLTTVYISGVYDGEKKVQDKIKAKIEEIENSPYWADCGKEYDNDIKLLKELLEDK